MCPEHQVYSLYLDNELPSPWKEKFEAHLASCANCQTHLEKYKTIQTAMQKDRIEISQELESRVWNKIIAGNNKELAFNNRRNRNLLRRSISVPLPAVAAAAAVLVFAAFLAIQNPRTAPVLPAYEPAMAQGFGNGNNLQEMINVSDMNNINDVLQYLSREDTSDFLIIRLPEYREFSSIGDPELIRAADYSRRDSSR